jgi:hypothetical protein
MLGIFNCRLGIMMSFMDKKYKEGLTNVIDTLQQRKEMQSDEDESELSLSQMRLRFLV